MIKPDDFDRYEEWSALLGAYKASCAQWEELYKIAVKERERMESFAGFFGLIAFVLLMVLIVAFMDGKVV